MEECQVREAGSEKQKPLPFNFRAPWLEFTKDNIKARIWWEAKGQIVADHQQHMVNSVGKGNRTRLKSSWMLSTEAKQKLETLLAHLQQGSAWLNMYEITTKACEEVKPLQPLVTERHGCRATCQASEAVQ